MSTIFCVGSGHQKIEDHTKNEKLLLSINKKFVISNLLQSLMALKVFLNHSIEKVLTNFVSIQFFFTSQTVSMPKMLKKKLFLYLTALAVIQSDLK